MDAATRLRKDHQALVGEPLGLSMYWNRTWANEIHSLGMEVRIAEAREESIDQHPLQDLNPASPNFGKFYWMAGYDPVGSLPIRPGP